MQQEPSSQILAVGRTWHLIQQRVTGAFNRNDLTTIDEAIRAHGGAARKTRDLYLGLTEENRRSLIAYLKTLVIE